MTDLSNLLQATQKSMQQALEHLDHELNKLRTGKASTAILEGIMVSYYGSPTPLSQIANVSTADSRTLTITPWERTMLGPIEKAIFESSLGITPMNDGIMIRLSIPPLTEERRKDLVKKAKACGEESKVGVRSGRRDAMEAVKKAVKDGMPEDAGKRKEAEIEDLTKKFIERVDQVVAAKEKDILTV